MQRTTGAARRQLALIVADALGGFAHLPVPNGVSAQWYVPPGRHAEWRAVHSLAAVARLLEIRSVTAVEAAASAPGGAMYVCGDISIEKLEHLSTQQGGRDVHVLTTAESARRALGSEAVASPEPLPLLDGQGKAGRVAGAVGALVSAGHGSDFLAVTSSSAPAAPLSTVVRQLGVDLRPEARRRMATARAREQQAQAQAQAQAEGRSAPSAQHGPQPSSGTALAPYSGALSLSSDGSIGAPVLALALPIRPLTAASTSGTSGTSGTEGLSASGSDAAPVLPGAGGSRAEAALLEQSRGQGGTGSTLDDDASSSLPAPLTPLAARLMDLCREGRVQELIRLLDGYTGGGSAGRTGSAPGAGRDGKEAEELRRALLSHDPDHGATALHLLAAAPVAAPAAAPAAAAHAGSSQPSAAGSAALIDAPSSSPAVDTAPTIGTALSRLVSLGADVNAPTANGATPLHWAAGAGNMPAVQALLGLGADPLACTYTWRRQVFGRGSGQTPVHWAAESNHTAIVQVLTQVSPLAALATDERGKTPRDAALAEIATGSANLLQGVEASPWVVLRVRTKARVAKVLGQGQQQGHQGRASQLAGADLLQSAGVLAAPDASPTAAVTATSAAAAAEAARAALTVTAAAAAAIAGATQCAATAEPLEAKEA